MGNKNRPKSTFKENIVSHIEKLFDYYDIAAKSNLALTKRIETLERNAEHDQKLFNAIYRTLGVLEKRIDDLTEQSVKNADDIGSINESLETVEHTLEEGEDTLRNHYQKLTKLDSSSRQLNTALVRTLGRVVLLERKTRHLPVHTEDD